MSVNPTLKGFLSSSFERVYFVETGFNLWTKCSYGRPSVGKRANGIVCSQRGRIAAVITSIAERAAMLYYELHFGNVNVETFQIFMFYLEEVLGVACVVVVMDNGPVQIGISEAFPDINIYFLRPCSPFFEPK